MQNVHALKILKVHCVQKKDLVETKYAGCTHVENAEGTLCKKNRLGSDEVCKIYTRGKYERYIVYKK